MRRKIMKKSMKNKTLSSFSAIIGRTGKAVGSCPGTTLHNLVQR